MAKSVVLSGGGSLGCFEAGFLFAIFDHIEFSNIYGTSAGSLNALLLSQCYINGNNHLLKDVWCKEIKGNSSIYTKSYIKTIFTGKPPYTYSPLRKLIKKIGIDFQKIIDSDKTLKTTSVDLVSGELITISNKEVGITPERLFESIIASASMPPVFPPVKIDNMQLVDGGVRANIPVFNLIDEEENNEAIIVLCFPVQLSKIEKEFSGAVEISSRSIDIMMNECAIDDLKGLTNINNFLKTQKKTNKNTEVNEFLKDKKIIDADFIIPEKEIPGNTLDFEPQSMKDGFEMGRLRGEKYLEDLAKDTHEGYHSF